MQININTDILKYIKQYICAYKLYNKHQCTDMNIYSNIKYN